MELSTTGIKYFEGKQIPLFVNRKEDFFSETGYNTRFCFILVEEGTGILDLNRERIVISSPSIFCLNEKDIKRLEKGIGLKARSVYFHPEIINSQFGLNNIRDYFTFTSSTKEDRDWLNPFIIRTLEYKGHLLIGIRTAKKIEELINKILFVLDNQDANWPCRSRSYLLELLFITYRLFLNPKTKEEMLLPEEESDIEQVVLYINMNYMNDITLESLVKIFHINRTTLSEKFISLTGEPIKKYITHLRIRIACMLLRDTLLPVEEILNRVGYNDLSNFGRTFRKLIGVSPSIYRSNNNWMKL